MTPFEITETIPTTSEYTEILTMIYNELVVIGDNIELLNLSLFFLGGIVAACTVALGVAYFIGQIMKTR